MKETNYIINGKIISYEIIENGYTIFRDDEPWFFEREPSLPYPELSFEEGCLKEIEALVEYYKELNQE